MRDLQISKFVTLARISSLLFLFVFLFISDRIVRRRSSLKTIYSTMKDIILYWLSFGYRQKRRFKQEDYEHNYLN